MMSMDVTANPAMQDAVTTLLDCWSGDPGNVKEVFTELKEAISGKSGVELDFKSRPGVSYSLRGSVRKSREKEAALFVLIDIIDDDPDNRWLSVCFYEEKITDPKQAGQIVPAGILGVDGYCFDVFEYSESDLTYLLQRIDVAYGHPFTHPPERKKPGCISSDLSGRAQAFWPCQ